MSPVTLQDWFGSVEAQADSERGFGVVVWGRRVEAERDFGRGGDATKATLSAYRMDQRLTDTSFVDREGTLVKLLGPSDEGRATLAGVPLAFIDSFRQGIPPAFQMMVGLAPTLLARASSEPISPRIPPGESPPPSPALAPSLSPSATHDEHLLVDSDDELLPPSLFDMQTGYVRSEGAVSTRKELYRALVEAKGRPVAEIEADSEPLLFTKDRDEGYDEDAEDAEDDGVPEDDSEAEPGHVEAEAGKEIVLVRADAGRAFTPPSSNQAIVLPQTPSALPTTRPSTPLTRPPTPSTLFHLSPFNNVSHSSLASIADLYQDSEADSNDGYMHDVTSFVDQDTEGLGSESVLRPIGEHPPIEDDVPAEEEPPIVEEPEVEGLSSTAKPSDTVPATLSAPPSLPPSPSPSHSLPLPAPLDPSHEHLDTEVAPEKVSVPAVEDDVRSFEVDEQLSAVVPEPSSSEDTESVELAAESPPSPAVVAPPPAEAATEGPQPSVLLEPEPFEFEAPEAEAAVPDPETNVDAADDEPLAEPPSESGREGANSHQHGASELEVMEVEPEEEAAGIEGEADPEASLSVVNPTLEEQLEEAAQSEPPQLPLPAEQELSPPQSVEAQLDEGEQEDGFGAADDEPLATNSLGSFDDSPNDFGGGGEEFGGGSGEYFGGEESPGDLGEGASWELVEQDADDEHLEQSVIVPRPSEHIPPPSPDADPAAAARSSQEASIAPPPLRKSSSSQPREKAPPFFVEVPVPPSLKRSRNHSPTRSEHSTSTDELSLLPVDSPVAAAPAGETSRNASSSSSRGKRRAVVSVEIPERRDVVASTSTLAPPAPPFDAGANDSEDDVPLAPRRRSSTKKKSRAPILPPSPSASDTDEPLQAAPSLSPEPSNATPSRDAPAIRSKSKSKTKGKNKARLPPSPSPEPSPVPDDPQPPPSSASLSVESVHAPPSPPPVSHSRPKPQKRASSSTAPTGPRRKLLKKTAPTTASTPAVASASFANRKGSTSRSKRGQTDSPAPAPTPTSTRPTRERKSAAGWWEIPNALNALRKSKLKRPREVVQPEEDDEDQEEPDPPIAEDEGEDDGKEEEEEEMVVVRPAKRSRREDQQQTDASGSQPSASGGTKKAVAKVKTSTGGRNGASSHSKDKVEALHIEDAPCDIDEETPLTWRTWLAILVANLATFSQLLAIVGPAGIISFLVQSLGGARLSDIYGRKIVAIIPQCFGIVGAIVASRANDMSTLLAGTCVMGISVTIVAINSTIPSEVLPRKYRTIGQATIQLAASAGTLSASLIGGAFVEKDPENGWRNMYYLLIALYSASTLGFIIGYNPPPLPSQHKRTGRQLCHDLDVIGVDLFATGFTLLLIGLNWGGAAYTWDSPHVVACLVVGLICILAMIIWGPTGSLIIGSFMRSERWDGPPLQWVSGCEAC
ncbi:hypothetical protein RQP46_006993 [Phenoliferia psychrophenolica]